MNLANKGIHGREATAKYIYEIVYQMASDAQEYVGNPTFLRFPPLYASLAKLVFTVVHSKAKVKFFYHVNLTTAITSGFPSSAKSKSPTL